MNNYPPLCGNRAKYRRAIIFYRAIRKSFAADIDLLLENPFKRLCLVSRSKKICLGIFFEKRNNFFFTNKFLFKSTNIKDVIVFF